MSQAQKMQVSDEIAVQLIQMNKWYGQFHVLRDIDLTVMRGERIVIAGPSGSGKSTMIRCINRLEEHQQGDIVVHGVTLSNDVKNIEAIRREVGMVFQSFNLFPHLTIFYNCHKKYIITIFIRSVIIYSHNSVTVCNVHIFTVIIFCFLWVCVQFIGEGE